MIIFNDILGMLKAAGYSTYRLRKDQILPESTIQSLRDGRPITTETIEKLCRLLNCQPGDLMRYELQDPSATTRL